MVSSFVDEIRVREAPSWHAPFLAMLPAIRKHAARAFRGLPAHDHAEAVQATVAFAAVAYARSVQLNRAHLGYAGPIARFGVMQYRSGRRVGSRLNSRDVTSPVCQRRRGFVVGSPSDASMELLVEDRRATPAEIAALRLDVASWLNTLSPRNRRLANDLAQGETTSEVARTFCVSPGRVSQIRRQLFESWRQFCGEVPAAAPAGRAAVRRTPQRLGPLSRQERTLCP
jgi:hypothetical protein